VKSPGHPVRTGQCGAPPRDNRDGTLHHARVGRHPGQTLAHSSIPAKAGVAFCCRGATSDRQIKSQSFFPDRPFETVIMDNFTRPLRTMSRTLPQTNGKGVTVQNDVQEKLTKFQSLIPTVLPIGQRNPPKHHRFNAEMVSLRSYAILHGQGRGLLRRWMNVFDGFPSGPWAQE